MSKLNDLQDEYKDNPSSTVRREIHEELRRSSEATFDMDNVKPQSHNWVKRGVVVSCEGAGHPNHRHFVRKELN